MKCLSILLLLLSWPAWAASIIFSPSSPTVACGTLPGTFVSTATLSGASPSHTRWSIVGGDVANFTLGRKTLTTADILVGAAGAISNCDGTVHNFTVKATY